MRLETVKCYTLAIGAGCAAGPRSCPPQPSARRVHRVAVHVGAAGVQTIVAPARLACIGPVLPVCQVAPASPHDVPGVAVAGEGGQTLHCVGRRPRVYFWLPRSSCEL